MRKLLLFFIIALFLINCISAVDIVYDDFEDGNLSEWTLSHSGTAVDWASSTTNPYQGTRHAQSRPLSTTEPASVMQRDISTSGYENIVFSYYKRNIGLDVADEFQAEWYDGSTWTIAESTGSSSSNDAAYVSRSYSLPAGANNNPNFAIKFECTAGATSEYCRIDNVNISGTFISCEENLQNTSWTDWINLGSCKVDDLQEQVRNRTQYDTNNCGYVNTTVYEYQNVSCNYCSYDNVNTTKSSWYDITLCNISDNKIQIRNWTEYDSNYETCYAITGLPSDLFINVTWYENQTAFCNYCSYSLVNTSWSNWNNLVCSGNQMNQSRNLTQYDENYATCYAVTGLPSDYYANQTFYEYQLVGPAYINTSWTNWMDISCLSGDIMNQTRNLTQYDSYGCALNQTFVEYRNTEFCDYCTPNLQNTTKGDWYYTEDCRIDDLRNRQRNWTQYDINNCGEVENQTYYENEDVVCDFCVPNRINTTWSEWYYLESCQIDDTREKQRNKTEYDTNNCYAITGLPSDLFENVTYHENDSEVCDYCAPLATNTTWIDWMNYGSCLITDEQQQNRSREQYDSNGCYTITGLPADEFVNETFWDWRNISCNYCSYNAVNSSLSNWENISCLINNLMNQSRFKIEYDENYGSCYAVTGLLSDLWNSGNNNTYYEYRQTEICDYCIPNLINTSWGDWTNFGDCLVNDTQVQIRNLTQYDSNNCGEIANETIYSYQEIACDFCTPNMQNTSWTEWQNQENCKIDDLQLQNRSKTEHDTNNCGEVQNVTYWEYQNISCDYCTPILLNTTKGDWYFIEDCQIDDLRNRQRNWTQYDINNCGEVENQTYYENEDVVCDFLTINCEIGGPYQQGALVLFIGNVSNSNGVLIGEEVDIGLYKNNELNLSKILQTSEDGDFETSFLNLGVGNYKINASVSYQGANETCTDVFQVGSPASLILDKMASIHNLSNNEIYYNISLRVLNKGGSECINSSLNDLDYPFIDYDLGILSSDESVVLSYLMNFTRQNTTTYYELSAASVGGIDSYSNNLIFANSSLIILTIPASTYTPGKQLVITKNIIFVEETSLNITYNVSSVLYNTGDEDLFDVVYIDTDIYSSSLLLNISRGNSQEFSNLVVINKAASNIEYEFELGTAVVDSLSFYSNRPKVKIPGYGGPADAIVSAPVSVPVSTSFDTMITIENQNPDIGQDFIIDYWITNNDELINYSSGQQTIYVSALGSSNLTATLISPDSAGNYKLKAIVLWAGGTASAFDSFEVVSEQTVTPPTSGGGGGGGIVERPGGVNVTIEVEGAEEEPEEAEKPEEIICNPPYIRYGKECCLDGNNNEICDGDETDRGITGLFIRDDGSIYFNYPLLGLLLLLLLIIFIIYKLIRRLPNLFVRKRKEKNNMRIKKLIGLCVYTSDGIKIGFVKEVYLKENKIGCLKIKLARRLRKKIDFRTKGILLNYKHVENIGNIVIIEDKILNEIELRNTYKQ